MKGKHVEDQGHHHHHNNHHNAHSHHDIFSKLPPPHLHNQPPKFQHSHFPRHSEEADSAITITTVKPTTTPTPTPPSSKKPKTSSAVAATTTSEDGGTIEVSRRPRGRPAGSKNRPKPPIVITREPEPAMSPYILEIPGGSDIIDSLTRFARRRGIGLCVLTASGSVANVTLKQPSTAAPGGTVTFHGRFDILSLSAVLLLQTMPFGNNNGEFSFSISLAGPQGQIVGGKVVGPLLASGVVYIIAASFDSPSYHRLPVDGQEVQNNPSACGDGQSSSPVSGGEGSGSGGGGGGPMGIYSCHMGSATSDVIWAPTARPPPPPPY